MNSAFAPSEGREFMSDCIFCKIVAGEIPSDIVHQSERVVAFRDVHPQAPTHVQVIPRSHVEHIADFDAERDTDWLVELVEVANRIAREEGLDKGYRLVFNNGPLAGQSVFHVHLHLLGGRQLGWPPG
jgi:histidine triad (HIT) family protein